MTVTQFTNNPTLTQSGVTISGGGLIATSSLNQSGITYALWPNNADFPIYAECTIDTIASGLCILFGAQFPVGVLGVCVDATNRKVWFTADGVTWNGNSIGVSNPASNLGGNVIPWSGDIHAGYTFSTVGDWVNFNFGQAPFILTPPTGATAWGASETIGSADTNLTVGPDGVSVYLSTAATYPSCYTTGGKSSGLWYFEMPMIGRAGQSGPGFCAAGHTLIDYLGSDGNSSGCYPWSGNMYGWGTVDGFIASPVSFLNPDLRNTGSECWAPKNDGTSTWTNNTTAIGAFGAGNTVGMAFDPPSRQIWFTLDGMTWAGVYGMTADPVAKTNGNVVSYGPAMIALTLALSGCQVTLNTTGSFVLPVPSGYVAWDGAAPPPPATPLPVPVGRLQRLFQKFFEESPFEGRRRRDVGKFLYVPPPPVVPQLPNPTRNRLLRAFANFFETEPYPGRNVPRFNYGGGVNLPARASQIIAEALVRSADPAVRAGQVVSEALIQDKAQVRAGQSVVEVLYQQTNPSYVRAGQVVVEVLVPFLEFPVVPIYPELPGLTFSPFIKRPKYSTGVGVGSSGREVRIGYWANPQWEWDLKYDTLGDNQSVWNYQGGTASDLKTLLGFVLSRYGAQAPFYFRDPDDCAVTNQEIGVGDGGTKQFVFYRTYGLTETGTEPIGGLNMSEDISIYLNGVLQTSGFTIDNSIPCGNFVMFDTAPGAGVSVTASFQFYFYCRFKDDSTDFEKFMKQLWENQKITIFSLKN